MAKTPQATPDNPNPVATRPHAGSVMAPPTASRSEAEVDLSAVQDPSRIGTDYPDPRTMGANGRINPPAPTESEPDATDV